MSRIDEAIKAAQAELSTAQALPDTDEGKSTKVAGAQAKVTTLQSQKQAIEDEINDAVRNRLPDAEKNAKESERKTVAAALGIPVEQLTDEKLSEVKQAYQGQQTEADRYKQELATEREAREKAEKNRDENEKAIRANRLRDAISDALDTRELRPNKKKLALRSIDTSGINMDEQGNITGVDEAADALKTEEASWFEAAPPEDPSPTPPGKQGGKQGSNDAASSWVAGQIQRRAG